MKEKILQMLSENSIEIKNLDKIITELELFFTNSNLDDNQRVTLLKIISKLKSKEVYENILPKLSHMNQIVL